MSILTYEQRLAHWNWRRRHRISLDSTCMKPGVIVWDLETVPDLKL